MGGVQIALALSALPRRPGPSTIAQALMQIARLRTETRLDDRPREAQRLLLDPDRVADLRKVLAGHRPSTRGTTHISAVDRTGMGAALTISNGEGNGRLLPGTGIMPNNMLGEEDLVAGGPTAWTPDQRLASMMCPTMLRDRDGTVTMLGSGGSNRIRSALTTVALHLIDEGMGLEDAICAPRMHVEGRHLSFEDTGSEALREVLLAEHPEAGIWTSDSMFFGGVHAVRRTRKGDVDAFGDPRRSGAVAKG